MRPLSAPALAVLVAAISLPGSPARAQDEVAYACDSGLQIRAVYQNGENPGARLTFKGRTFELYQVRSGSGARYATEQGLSPDHGLQWWVKGDEATLSEMIMDHTAPGPTVIDTCRVAPPKE